MNKKVVILGASSGIGRATAIRFSKEGYQVLVVGRNTDKCKEVEQNLVGKGHFICPIDISDEKQLKKLSDFVKEVFGDFDVFINSVGVSHNHPIFEIPFQEWDQSLQIMLYGAVKSVRLLAPLINDGGRIIHITSIHHNRVAVGSSAYGMAKAALTQFTRSLAVELAPRKILANAIAPGFIDTPMSVKEDGKNELDSKWFYENYVKGNHLALRRAGRPEEVAGVAFFLAGEDASYMTGSVLTVDGGLTITF